MVDAGDVSAWPEPQEIPDALLPVQPFAYDLLPNSLRIWVQDIAERMQCPPDFVAVAVMVALSSLIGRRACIRPKRLDDWKVSPNLWGLIIGRPGVMKSPPLAEVIKPLYRMEARAKDRFDEEQKIYGVDGELAQLRLKAAQEQARKSMRELNETGARSVLEEAQKQAATLQPPSQRRYISTDTTVEALADILRENPLGLLIYRDELYGLLCSLDKQGQEGSRSFYLQGYDGDKPWTSDRIGRGKYLHVASVCFAMLGCIQPGRLSGYIRDALAGGSGDDGLIQRFGLAVWPDVPPEWRNVDRLPDKAAREAALAAFERLGGLQPDTDQNGDQRPREYRFAADAQYLFDTWRGDLERELRGDLPPALESHLAKYRKLIPALALIIALADDEEEVSKESLLMALAWSEYLRSHAERMYATGSRPDVSSAKALLAKIKAGRVQDGFTDREVYRKCWSDLSDTKAVAAATELLVDLGYLRKQECQQGVEGGRPSARYQIHPEHLKEDRS